MYDDISVVLFLLFLSPKLKEMTKQLQIFLFEENKELLTAMANTGHANPRNFSKQKGCEIMLFFGGYNLYIV